MVQVAAHPEGKHFLALTKNGEVFSWGNGDSGQLGHGDTSSLDAPKKVAELAERNIVFVAGKLTMKIMDRRLNETMAVD